jgi:sigma-B regulation protein RsbU (phosphoserine phosphatase)
LENLDMGFLEQAVTPATIPDLDRSSALTSTDFDLLRRQQVRAHARMRSELKEVAEIQRALLPERLPVIPGFDVAPYYQPSALAGGDYFDIVPLVEGRWGLVIADVAGHGVSSAVIMSVMRALIHAHLPHTRFMPSAVFLGFINQQMMGPYTREGRFVTVWCAILDPVTRELTYASAGHNPPRLVRHGRVIPLDKVGGPPMGVDEAVVYKETSVMLEPGDLLVAYTDGITEAMRYGPQGRELFCTERLDRVLLDAGAASATDCVTRVASAVRDFSETEVPVDDQTMLVLRVA